MAINNPTTNFSWVMPTEGGSSGTWDTLLNTLLGGDGGGGDIEGIDEIMGDVQTTANAALPKAGGVMTGEIEHVTDIYGPVTLGTSGTVTVDLSAGNFFTITPSGTVTFAFSNEPATGKVGFFHIEFTNGVAQTINWPIEVEYVGGSAPVLTANKDLIVGYTRDGGATIVILGAGLDIQ